MNGVLAAKLFARAAWQILNFTVDYENEIFDLSQ